MSKILWGMMEVPNIRKMTVAFLKEMKGNAKTFPIDTFILVLVIAAVIYWAFGGKHDVIGILAIVIVYIIKAIMNQGRLLKELNGYKNTFDIND